MAGRGLVYFAIVWHPLGITLWQWFLSFFIHWSMDDFPITGCEFQWQCLMTKASTACPFARLLISRRQLFSFAVWTQLSSCCWLLAKRIHSRLFVPMVVFFPDCTFLKTLEKAVNQPRKIQKALFLFSCSFSPSPTSNQHASNQKQGQGTPKCNGWTSHFPPGRLATGWGMGNSWTRPCHMAGCRSHYPLVNEHNYGKSTITDHFQ